jgi:hypothetical protein
MIELASFLLIVICGGSVIGGLLLARARSAARWRLGLVAYALRFPRGLDAGGVTAFMTALSGLSVPRARRPFIIRAVVLETTATQAGIAHHLLVSRSDADIVLSAMRAALPWVLVTRDENYQPFDPTVATELGLSTHRRPLSVDKAGMVSSHILASLQPLGPREQLVVQWSARPVGPQAVVAPAAKRPAKQTFIDQMWDVLTARDYNPESVKAARAKQASPLFICSGRVGAVAGSSGQAGLLVSRVLAAFHPASAPGVHLYRRRLSGRQVVRALRERRLPLITYPVTLNAAELGTLVGFPVGEVTLPGLNLGGCRQLAPAADIPSGGRIVASGTFPGAERPLALSVTDSLRHLHVIAPTGAGKSTLMLGLAVQDMAAGRGIVVVDPKGDLVADVLDRVPPNRVSDVCLLDPTDEDRPVGLNLLSGATAAPELVADQVVGIFHQLYASSWGPRTADILRSALLTLAGEPGMTLTEVPLLLTDPAFRRKLVGRVDDPVALGPFWGWFDGLSEGERAAAIGPVMNKLRAFLLSRRLRNVLGQASPRLDLGQALADKQILLVPLSKGLLGEEAAALIGSLVLTRIWQAVQRRAGLPASQRPVTFAYIDEFQDYLRLPLDMADALAQARGLGLGLTLAHQHLGQLPTAVRDAVLANARSRVIFQLSASDAHTLARELAPYLTATDLGGLGPYEVVATLSTGGRVAPPATGVTLPPPAPTGQAAAARAASRDRYGIDRQTVERQIQARHEGRRGSGAVGRRGVQS